MAAMNAGAVRRRLLRLAPRREDRFILLVEALLLLGLLLAWHAASRRPLGAADIAIWLMAATPLALSAMTQTLPVLAGGHGLAAGSTALLVNAVVAIAPIASGTDALLWIVVGLALGAAVGAVNGTLIGQARLPTIAVTFATSVAVASLAQYLAANAPAPTGASSILQDALDLGSWWLPLLLILVFCAGGIALQMSSLGRGLAAMGHRPGLAQQFALPTARWRMLAYTIAGLGYGATGVFLAAQVGSVDLVMGAPLLLQIYAAVALGGGVPGLRAGSVPGSLLGALVVSATGNLMLPIGLDDYLSSGFDAFWLLLGLASCVALVRLRPQSAIMPPPLPDPPATNSGLAMLALGLLSILVLLFIEPANRDLLTIASLLPLLVVGQGAVMRAGGLDFAMPALVAFAGIGIVTLSQGLNDLLPLSVPVILIVAILIGALQGRMARRLRRGIVVLGLALGGLLLTVADALVVESPTGFAPSMLTGLATTRWGGLPPVVWFAVPLALGSAWWLDRHGPHWQRAAYWLSAVMAALFGLAMAGFAGQYKLGTIDTYLTPTFVAAVLGGISFMGGRGSLLAGIGASLLIRALDSLLIAAGWSFEFRLIGFAALLLLAVAWQEKEFKPFFRLQALLPAARRERS
jgi:ribose transport system permease protein